MLGLKLWGRNKRETISEVGAVLLKEIDLYRQAIADLRFADKQRRYSGRPDRQCCIFDPTAEYVIRI